MSYDCIRYEDLVEGQDILAFGYHVVRWDWDVMGTPAYGFVPSKADDEIERLKVREERYKDLIEHLYLFLEKDRLVRSHSTEMGAFFTEYREIKKESEEE